MTFSLVCVCAGMTLRVHHFSGDFGDTETRFMQFSSRALSEKGIHVHRFFLFLSFSEKTVDFISGQLKVSSAFSCWPFACICVTLPWQENLAWHLVGQNRPGTWRSC